MTPAPQKPAVSAMPAAPVVAKFHPEAAPRPMLSRDADAMYWMSRYVERAEHAARILLVSTNLLIDVADLAPQLEQRHWNSIVRIMRVPDPPPGDGPLSHRIASYMTFGPGNPSSILHCLTRARENARAIRENISAEMWEGLNTLYWAIRGDDVPQRFEEAPDEVYRVVMTHSMLFQGLTDQTLDHDQGWLFTQLAKYLERIDVTSRIMQAKYEILHDAQNNLETPLRNIHWMSVLRTCCSIEAYRRRWPADLDPLRVVAFVLLEETFPRSIRYSVNKAHDAAAAIRALTTPRAVNDAERILGRLCAQLDYAEMDEILSAGLPLYLQRIQDQAAEAAVATQKRYFLS